MVLCPWDCVVLKSFLFAIDAVDESYGLVVRKDGSSVRIFHSQWHVVNVVIPLGELFIALIHSAFAVDPSAAAGDVLSQPVSFK